ncbi:putative signal transducing protein [Litchfieldella rifensis]|uniref:Signal transducing protein n=1 Tax=Litchfieldella rifensis TaxID=762643 RepID=A0ABV7LQB0_9GAMM
MADYVRVFRHSNALLVSHIQNVLIAAGIPAELRNMTLGGGAGELPLGECEPEVWVAAHNAARADALVRESLQGASDPAPDWVCPHCGESLGGAFETCWKCGTDRSHGA